MMIVDLDNASPHSTDDDDDNIGDLKSTKPYYTERLFSNLVI